jgi:hypothetical protein
MKGLVTIIVSVLAISTVNLFSMEADREGAMPEYAEEMARADENRRREDMNQRLTQARLRAHRERAEQARQDQRQREQRAEQQDDQADRQRVGRRLNF